MHHRLNGHEFEHALGDSEGYGSLAYCSPWGCKESDMTEQLNNTAAKSLQSCSTLCNPIDGNPPGSPRPRDSPGKNTGVGCHFLLQGIFPNQRSNSYLLQVDSLPLSHLRIPGLTLGNLAQFSSVVSDSL